MDFLARREHSFYELQQKLSNKYPDVSADLLFSVIDKLRQENLQSDNRFAESYVRYRTGRGFGILHIRADMNARKVDQVALNNHLDSVENWDELLQGVIVKKLKLKPKLARGSKEHKKLTGFLNSRGFTPEQIRKGIEFWLV